jgi:hypothetical protein
MKLKVSDILVCSRSSAVLFTLRDGEDEGEEE